MNPLLMSAAASAVQNPEIINKTVDTGLSLVKIITYAGLGTAAFLIGRKMYKKYKLNAGTRQTKEAINSIDVNSSGLSITQSDAKIIASQLFAAMSKTGTDTDTILRLLENKTPDDVRLIIKFFGVKPYGTFGTPAYTWLPSIDLDLMGWIKREISGNKLATVQNIFAAAGISF